MNCCNRVNSRILAYKVIKIDVKARDCIFKKEEEIEMFFMKINSTLVACDELGEIMFEDPFYEGIEAIFRKEQHSYTGICKTPGRIYGFDLEKVRELMGEYEFNRQIEENELITSIPLFSAILTRRLKQEQSRQNKRKNDQTGVHSRRTHCETRR